MCLCVCMHACECGGTCIIYVGGGINCEILTVLHVTYVVLSVVHMFMHV